MQDRIKQSPVPTIEGLRQQVKTLARGPGRRKEEWLDPTAVPASCTRHLSVLSDPHGGKFKLIQNEKHFTLQR